MQVEALDRVIKNAIKAIQESKYQIYEIIEGARAEKEKLQRELQQVMEEVSATINQVDKLEILYRKARLRLTEVSRDLHRYKEEDIRIAYEAATSMQLQLTISREKESQLKQKRDELQKRIRNVDKQLLRAETIGSQLNVVLEYLTGDLNQVTRMLESAKNRQLLGLKIIMAQEEERRRIAREIHDGLAQSMAHLVLRSEISERMLARKEYDLVKQELNDLKGQVRSGLEEVRKIIFNLRPMMLDDLGLIPTLRKLVQDFEERTKIRTEYEASGKEARLPSGMEVAIYRLVQEAFNNVYKHAQATFVSLHVMIGHDQVTVMVYDNGVGFDHELVEAKMGKGTHFGLVGMKERIELLDGELKIESSRGNGTRITMKIPVGDKRTDRTDL